MMTTILDTDIGTDIDDAFALIYLLKKKTLAGITTVFRNSVKRARLCKAIMHSMNIEGIEVYAGVDAPFIQEPEKIEPPQCKQNYDEKGAYIPPQCAKEYDVFSVPVKNAVQYMIETCRASENTEIVAIGALTNIAAALRIAPDIIPRLRLTIMGGCLKKLSLNGEDPHHVAEWNILCDPEAAHIVFSSGVKARMVGLDVTLDCALPQRVFERIQKLGVCPILDSLIKKWSAYYSTSQPILFDPVAAASLYCDCLTFETKKMNVVLEGKDRGATVESEGGFEIEVAVSRNNEAFYNEFLSILEKKDKELP